MKKTLALLLCLAMLFTALTVNVFADENPTVTIVTSSVSEKGETSFAINLAGFESLKGVDMTVTATAGIEMLSASALNFKDSNGNIIEIVKDTDYVISADGRTLHIVGLQKDVKGDVITVDAIVTADATIAVKVDLAKSGTELYDEITVKDAKIAAYTAPTDVDVEAVLGGNETATLQQSAAGEGYFIPYGSVYNGEPVKANYVPKDENGNFVVSAGTVVKKFAVPENGITTFGASDSTVKDLPAKQFGTFAKDYAPDTKTYGTLVIMGDWAGFKGWYLSNKAYSDAVIIEKLYAAFETANPLDEGERRYDYVTFEAGTSTIKVYNVAQKKYMWKSEADGILEYAVRVYGLENNTAYTAVAYNASKENPATDVIISKEIKTETYTEKQ